MTRYIGESICEPIEQFEFESILSNFRKCIGMHPECTITDENTKTAFTRLRDSVIRMISKSNLEEWLVDLFDNDIFVKFYTEYLDYLCIGSDDRLSTLTSRCVANFIKLHMIVWNISDSLQSFSLRLLNNNIPERLVKLISQPELVPSSYVTKSNARLLVHCSIGILHNISKNSVSSRTLYRRLGLVNVITNFLFHISEEHEDDTSQELYLRAACLLLLSYIMNESESIVLNSVNTHIKYLLTALESAINSPNTLFSALHGFHAVEILQGLCQLAGPDCNKIALVECNALQSIEDTLRIVTDLKRLSKNNSEQRRSEDIDAVAEKSLEFLWTLTFIDECRNILKPGSLCRGLVESFTVQNGWSRQCVFNAQGLIFNLATQIYICDRQLTKEKHINAKSTQLNGHIMISYQHKDQAVMLKFRNALLNRGFRVWMDVDSTAGSFLDCMAHAIKNASGLLLGVSQSFKNSSHCRQEVLYAFELGIPFYPVILESNFYAEGWLGAMLAQLHSIPLDADTGKVIDQLIMEFGLVTDNVSTANKITTLPSIVDQSTNDATTQSRANLRHSYPPVADWSRGQVSNWISHIGLGNSLYAFQCLTGAMLWELARLTIVAPNGLVKLWSQDFQWNVFNQVKFYGALRNLYFQYTDPDVGINKDSALEHDEANQPFTAH